MISPDRFRRIQNSATATNTRQGPSIVASATPHTKGSWTSLIAATSFDAFLCAVNISDVASNTVDTSMLVDIGSDPAAGTAYTVQIPNILAGGAPVAGNGIGRTYWFPVSISKGSQVAARIQALVVSDTARVGVTLIGGKNRSNPFPHRGAIQDYGTDTATSGGTVMADAGIDTKAAWVQLGADTTRRHSGLVVAFGTANAAVASTRYLVDIGIDPAGGTTFDVVIPDIFIAADSAEIMSSVDPLSCLLGIDIPLGSAIAARAASLVANLGTNIDVAVYGF